MSGLPGKYRDGHVYYDRNRALPNFFSSCFTTFDEKIGPVDDFIIDQV